jgi:hypothetical protein
MRTPPTAEALLVSLEEDRGTRRSTRCRACQLPPELRRFIVLAREAVPPHSFDVIAAKLSTVTDAPLSSSAVRTHMRDHVRPKR